MKFFNQFMLSRTYFEKITEPLEVFARYEYIGPSRTAPRRTQVKKGIQ